MLASGRSRLLLMIACFQAATIMLCYGQTDQVGAGRTLTFAGVGNYIELQSDYSSVNLPFTITAWVKVVDNPAASALVLFSTNDNNPLYHGFWFAMTRGAIWCEYGDNQGGSDVAFRQGKRANVPDFYGKWTHLAAVMTSTSQFDLYVNGVNVGGFTSGGSSSPMKSPDPGDKAKIGYFLSNGVTYGFEGEIDEMTLWNRPLTETEIRINMCRRLSGSETGLLSYWSFDETSGTTTFDKAKGISNGIFKGIMQHQFSGAPVGDVSAPFYQANWGTTTVSLADPPSQEEVAITAIDENIEGVHIYEVKSPPVLDNGLPEPVARYFGVFLVSNNIYTSNVSYKKNGNTTCSTYKRPDNTYGDWIVVSQPVTMNAQHSQFAGLSAAIATDPDAGDDVNVCWLRDVKMNATLADGSTGAWSTITGSGDFSDVSDPEATMSNLGIGENKFKWTVTTPGCGSSSDEVTVKIDVPVQPDAGDDVLTCASAGTIDLSGNAPYNTTALWTVAEGTATIADDHQPVTTASNLSAGINRFVLSFLGNDYCTLMKDTITINISGDIKADAGEDQRVCAKSPGVTLFGNVVAGGDGKWTLVSGAGTLLDDDSPTTVVKNPGLGTNVFKWTVSGDVSCPVVSDLVNVVVDAVVEPDAGDDQTVCEGTLALALSGNTPYNRTGQWTLINGGATILNDKSPTTIVTNIEIGVNNFVWSFLESNYCPLMSDTVSIRVQSRPSAHISMPDTTFTCASDLVLKSEASNGQGEWTVTKGSGNISNAGGDPAISFDDVNKPVEVTWTVRVDGCPPEDDSAIIFPLDFSIEKVPNVITPNSDGFNDQWKIPNIDRVANQIRVCNRWGEDVFNTLDYKNNWTASNLTPGVYFFFINIGECKKEFKGWLNIIN